MAAGAEIMRVSTAKSRVEYKAYAKVNLSLGIAGRRPDGYHEISTVMAPVRVYDRISVEVFSGGPSIRVSCPALSDLPFEKNLAYKAAVAFVSEAGAPSDVSIAIDKRIPPGSGTGGGSSDAAAVLVALNDLVPRAQVLDLETLTSLAARIGADVPFFLGCDSRPPIWEGAICTGIGDAVSPMIIPEIWLVLAFSESAVDTRRAYARWDEFSLTGRERMEAGELDKKTGDLLTALRSGSPARVGECLFNDLESAVLDSYPEIGEVKARFLECGALGASMTGSGSAVFGIAGSHTHAKALAERLGSAVSGSKVREIIVTRTGVDRDAC